MNLKCPKCTYEFDFRQATKDQATLQIIRIYPEFVPYNKLVFEYAELFETTKPVKPLKLLRILSEVLEMWKSGRFAFQKRVYEISKEGMAQALKTVCNKSFSTPLENHNYLKKVMLTIAEEEAKKKSAAAEKALLEKEAMLRGRGKPEDLNNFERPVALGDVAKNLPWRKQNEGR